MNRAQRVGLLSAAASFCFTGSMVAAVAAQSKPAGIAVGPNVRVSTARADEAHYEAHAAAHPTNPMQLLATGIIYPKVGKRGTIVYASSDGGVTWTPSFQGDNLENTGDPAVAYGPDGTAYFATLTARGNPLEDKPEKPAHNWDGRKTLLYRLSPNAKEWTGPATMFFADREYIAIDDTKGKYNGRLYISGDPRPDNGFVVFTSMDGGRTFPVGQGALADARGGGSIASAVIASDGTLIGIYADPSHARATVSTDGGKSFLPSSVIDTFVRAGGRKDAGHSNVSHFMNVAIDRSSGAHNDRLYVAWPDRRSGHSIILFTYSNDKGRTWTRPRAVTDNPASDTTDQFMPTMAVNRDGVLGMLWYDRRDNPDNIGYYARFTASLDGGVTWLPSVKVSAAPYVAGPVSQKSAFAGNGGDTAGLIATADGTFHPVWVDDRTGIPQLWTATVKVQRVQQTLNRKTNE